MKNPCRIDIAIRGGEICDGSGAPIYCADVGVSDDRIASIGDLSGASSQLVINARNLIVSPGFIDIHSHTDENILFEPHSYSKVYQGVTTEVVGNCGSSPAPLYGEFLDDFKKNVEDKYDFQVSWSSVSEFLNILSERKIGINYIMLVGNANLRGGVVGYENRPPLASEVELMRTYLAKALEEGAWGLSSGLIYVPSCFSRKDELVRLAEIVADYDGIYSTHMRGEGDSLLEAINEAIAVAQSAGVKLQISHLKASGEKNWGKLDRAIESIEVALENGVRVGCDLYPYNASSTGLDSLFPLWAKEGGTERFLGNLRSKEMRRRIGEQFGPWEWKKIIFSSVRTKESAWVLGKSVMEVSVKLEKEPIETVMDILIQEDCDVAILYFAQAEENVRKVMMSSFSLFGSDACSRSGLPRDVPVTDLPHPRAYGTFPRILGFYVREEKVLPLEEAVKKMTYLTALRLGLGDRGLLAEGKRADITIFDPAKIRERSTYQEPHQYPEGVEYVIINGEIVIEHGAHTGALPGKVLKKRITKS